MSDFNYEVERTDHYFFENFTIYGKSVQDGIPTPDAPVPIEVVSDLSMPSNIAWKQGGVSTTTGKEGSDANRIHTAMFEIVPGATYTVGVTNSSYQYSVRLFSGTRWASSDFVYSDSTWKSSNDTYANPDAKYMCIVIRLSSNANLSPSDGESAGAFATTSCIGLVAGDTATPIDLQGNVLASLPDGTRDEVNVDEWGHARLIQRVGHVVLNGSETWNISSGNKRVYTAVGNVRNVSGSTALPIVCSHFEAKSAGQTYGGTIGISGMVNNSEIGYVRSTRQTTVAAEKTWLASNPVTVYYQLATPQTIDLGYIDVSFLQNIETEIPISLMASIETDTTYSYANKPTYKVLNPYEDYNAPNYAYPPVHFGQDWEMFDSNDWNVSEMLDYTYQKEGHAVYTIQLFELKESGAFDWSRPEIDWSEAAYSQEQYERFCSYFEARFMFREISIIPPLEWFTALRRMLVFELMPKYKPLYEQVEGGLAPLGENEYYKRRHITSNYPETLLSGNSDYITTGDDEEFERVKVDNAAQAMKDYRDGFASVDKAMADELEVLFVGMYTSYVNGL